MPTVALFNQDGTQNGDVQLNEAVFGIEPNELAVVVRSHGVKRVQVVLAKVLSAHHNGLVVVPYSVLHLAHMLTSFHVKCVAWLSAPSFLKRYWTIAW